MFFLQEGSDVLLESYALIQNCSSRLWLHLDKSITLSFFNFLVKNSFLQNNMNENHHLQMMMV